MSAVLGSMAAVMLNQTLAHADTTISLAGTGEQVISLMLVPEPVRLSLAVFVVMLLALAGLKWAWRSKQP